MLVKINAGSQWARVIGELFPEQHLFKKNVALSKHLFKKMDAWGIDAQYFTDVLKPNNYDIEIYECEEKKIYKTTAEQFVKKGQHYHFINQGIDNRAQIFLSRRFWQVLSISK
jgi:hypothetical protein